MRCERDIIIAANMIIYDDQRGLHLLDVGVLGHGHVGDVQLDHVQLGRVSHFLPSDHLETCCCFNLNLFCDLKFFSDNLKV